MSLKISEEEYKRRLSIAKYNLEKYLNITNYYTSEELEKYYAKIDSYLRIRIDENVFLKNLIEKTIFFRSLGYSLEDISKMIYNFPSLLHMDKREVLIKYLLLGKIVVSNTLVCDRDDIILNHTKDLICGKELLYARIMFFLTVDDINQRKNEITRRKTLKITSNEFFNTYRIDKQKLLKLFPFNSASMKIICSWKENEDVMKKLFDNGIELK